MVVGSREKKANEVVVEPSINNRIIIRSSTEGFENDPPVIKKRGVSSHLKIVLFGQFISVTMATLWSTQSTLYLHCSLSIPAFSNLWVYLILAFFSMPLYLRGRRIRKDPTIEDPPFWFLGKFPLRLASWKYFGIAMFGVQANYFMMLALKYTTLTSVSLFDAVAIPSAMILSSFVFHRKYRCAHILGASLCLLGMTVNVVTDWEADKKEETDPTSTTATTGRDDGSEEYPDKLIGDAFAILGGFLYGVNDVFAEQCVREYGGVTEYLAMMGFFGIFISGIQAAILERQKIATFFSGGTCAFYVGLSLLITYVMCQVIRKMSMSVFLLMSEAAFLNLSMLTADLHTTIFSIVAQNIFPRNFFFVGLSMVLTGITIYELAPSPVSEGYEKTHGVAPPPPLPSPPPLEEPTSPVMTEATLV